MKHITKSQKGKAMSLMIKGINLPDKGDVICLEIYSDGSVWDKSNWEPHPPKASAIQIPKDHGRLIDGDALENIINYDLLHRDKDNGFSTKSIWSYIEDAPTILEAEE